MLPVALAILFGLFYIGGAQAVHDDDPAAGITPYLFELDRNALDSPAGGADDWNTPPRPTGEAAVFTGILPDTGGTGDQFQGGGSKDDLDISQWLYKAGEPLDKDDITNAYAAGYVNTVDTGLNNIGHFIVYFGLDRFSNDGSAQVGFWFFKNQIQKTNNAAGGGFEFSGVHAVGDVLVQSNFSNGGVVDSVSVYKWVGSGGSNGSLDLLFSASDCVGPPAAGADDPACATVNRQNETAPWSYTPKSGTTGVFPQGSFFEGGINLTRLVPDIGCVSSFLAETRSSTPFDSRLKDLRLGDFNTCVAAVLTTASTTVNGVPATNVTPGSSVSDTATVTGSSLAGGTAPTPTGTVKFFLCQPATVTSNGGDCSSGGDQIGTPLTGEDLVSGSATSESTTNTTAIGKYCWRAEYVPATNSPYSAKSHTNSTTECFTTVAQPTTTTTRQFVFPQDSAKIVAPAGSGNLSGTVFFRLFDTSANCLADDGTATAMGLVFSSSEAVSGVTTVVKKTNQTTYRIDADATRWWHVIYDSTGNAAQLDSESDCVENTDVDFTGDDGTITIP